MEKYTTAELARAMHIHPTHLRDRYVAHGSLVPLYRDKQARFWFNRASLVWALALREIRCMTMGVVPLEEIPVVLWRPGNVRTVTVAEGRVINDFLNAHGSEQFPLTVFLLGGWARGRNDHRRRTAVWVVPNRYLSEAKPGLDNGRLVYSCTKIDLVQLGGYV